MKYELVHGDCLEVLSKMEDASVDAIITDPPYGLEFMGKEWDAPWKGDMRQPGDDDFQVMANPYGRSKVRHGVSSGYGKNTISNMQAFQKWTQKWAEECLRVLKPGGHILSFAGSRTYHRIASGIEDAGFEIRDQIMWIYGSGFPKSHNIGNKAEEWEGWGTALKPAHEPIVLARKPVIGSVAKNAVEYGTGGLNINATRIAYNDEDFERHQKASQRPAKEHEKAVWQDTGHKERIDVFSPNGRFPANVIHDGSDEVVGLFPHDSARFFYCPKANRQEKEAGLDSFEAKKVNTTDSQSRTWNDRCGSCGKKFIGSPQTICSCDNPITDKSVFKLKNHHPTVKPVDLMKYLCRLITPLAISVGVVTPMECNCSILLSIAGVNFSPRLSAPVMVLPL